MEKTKVSLSAYEILEFEVKRSGNTGRIYVPARWIGKKVKVLLLEALDDDSE